MDLPISINEILQYTNELQQKEIENSKENPPLNYDTVLDNMQGWQLDNAPILFLIEEATKMIQPANTGERVESYILKIKKLLRNRIDPITNLPSYPNISSAETIVLITRTNIDFIHTGKIPDAQDNQLNDAENEDLYSKMNKEIIAKTRNPQIKNILIILSLSFNNAGGHFAAVIAKPTGIYIFDPYFDYFESFKYITQRVLDQTKWDSLTIHQFGTSAVEINFPLQNPPNKKINKEKVIAQDSRNQDHFCWAWCTLFLHSFLESNCDMVKVEQFFNDCIFNKINLPRIVLIKQYILFLNQTGVMNFLENPFFYTFFNLIWHSANLANLNCFSTDKTLKIRDSTFKPDEFTSYYVSPALVERKPKPRKPRDINEQNLREYLRKMDEYMEYLQHKFKKQEIDYISLTQLLFGYINLSPANFDKNKILTIDVRGREIQIKTDSSTKKLIFDDIPQDKLTKYNVKINNNVLYISYIKILNIPIGHIDPDKWTEEYLNPKNFDNNNNDLEQVDCVRSAVNKFPNRYSRQVSDLFSLESRYYETPANLSQDPDESCTNIQKRITKRNEKRTDIMTGNYAIKGTMTGVGQQTCTGSIQPLHGYQVDFINAVVNKIKDKKYTRDPVPTGGQTIPGRYQGIIAWYGTGTGKTLQSSIVAKLLSFCKIPNIPFKNCYILSTKSAFTNFVVELQKENIFSDRIHLGESPESDYYRAGNIKIFSHSRFQNLYKDFRGLLSSELDLSESLIIIDEAHNFFNLSGKVSGDTKFALDFCTKAMQVVLLTATPMNNNPSDIETLLAMIDGRSKQTRNDFNEMYVGKFAGGLSLFSNPSNPQYNQSICDDSRTVDIDNIQITYSVDRTVNDKTALDLKFKDRIIYYGSVANTETPAYVQLRKCCKFDPITQKNLYDEMKDALYDYNTKLDDINISLNPEQSSSESFGSLQRTIIINSNIKNKEVLDYIQSREIRPENILSTDINPNPLLLNLDNLTYKYLIFSQQTETLYNLREYLIENNIGAAQIGIITGAENKEKRDEVAQRVNDGDIRIILITKAAEEGVDFKRISSVILMEPVYTWSEFEQIKGRAIRYKAHEQPLPTVIDIGKLVSKKVECVIITFYQIYEYTDANGDQKVKCSWDLLSFKNMYDKNAKIKKFTEDVLEKRFIPITPAPPMATYVLPVIPP